MIYSKLSDVASTVESVQHFREIIKIHTQESVKIIVAEYIEMLDDHLGTKCVEPVKIPRLFEHVHIPYVIPKPSVV